jgi:hypothetical protein
MQKTRLPLHKWFEAAALYNTDHTISAAEFARKLKLTKPTAWLLLKKIDRGSKSRERILLSKIATMWIAKTRETQRGKDETRP